jgi:hypothetical protein
MLIQLSESFLIATRLDAWDRGGSSGGAAVPDHLKEDLGGVASEADLPAHGARGAWATRFLPSSLRRENR